MIVEAAVVVVGAAVVVDWVVVVLGAEVVVWVAVVVVSTESLSLTMGTVPTGFKTAVIKPYESTP